MLWWFFISFFLRFLPVQEIGAQERSERPLVDIPVHEAIPVRSRPSALAIRRKDVFPERASRLPRRTIFLPVLELDDILLQRVTETSGLRAAEILVQLRTSYHNVTSNIIYERLAEFV